MAGDRKRSPGPTADVFGRGHSVLRHIEVLSELALWQTIRMVTRLLKMAGLEAWPVPDFSPLSRRQKTVTIPIPCRRSGGLLNLLLDRTGVKMRGDGEWRGRKHGPSRYTGLGEAGIAPALGRVGDSRDNASPPAASVPPCSMGCKA
jgi:hypothetical protein